MPTDPGRPVPFHGSGGGHVASHPGEAALLQQDGASPPAAPNVSRSAVSETADGTRIVSPPAATTGSEAVREALQNLLAACERADVLGELHDEVDGSLLDAARAALTPPSPDARPGEREGVS